MPNNNQNHSHHHLLSKLIRACALSAFPNRTTKLSLTNFQHYLMNISYAPFEKEFKELTFQIIIDEILKCDESKNWFVISSESIELIDGQNILSFPTPKVFKDDLDLLAKVTTGFLATGFRKIESSENKNLSLAHEKCHSINSSSSVRLAKKNASDDIVFVNTAGAVSKFLSAIRRLETKQIGFDCEGVNLGMRGRLTLVQISANGKQYLFDMDCKKPKNKQIICDAVKQVLGDPTITKIIHDCKNDLCGLKKDFEISVSSIVDTSILHQIINNTTQNISFNNLCQRYGVPGNAFKKSGESLHATQVWGKGIWTTTMLNYAAGDVRTLVQLYQTMMNDVQPDFQQQVLSAMEGRVSILCGKVLKKLSSDPAVSTTSPKTGILVKPSNKIKNNIVINEKSDRSIPIAGDYNTTIINQLYSFLDLFPKKIQEYISIMSGDDITSLIEVVMDKGRPYEMFYYHKKNSLNNTSCIVQQEEIDEIVKKLFFGTDNRAGIDGSLHRISSILNRNDQIIGLKNILGFD